MANFERVDMNTWARREFFHHYMHNNRCSYSMTCNVDITPLLPAIKEKGAKLYPVMIYLLTLLVNRHEEFRTAFDSDGNVGIWDEMLPSYTIFHKDDQTFSSIWSEFETDFDKFHTGYKQDMELYANVHGVAAKADEPANAFPISCVPWTSFTGFNINNYSEGKYLQPILTFGKFFEQGDKILLPFSIQVHHAVCDGFHTCRFVGELEELTQNPSLFLK